jgi:glycerate-2-kinase
MSPVTLEEKAELVRDLSRAGATIQELNTVRKRISEMKGKARLAG